MFKKNSSEFEKRCQECINQYGSRNFNKNLNYLFEGKYNPNNNSSNSFCYLVLISPKYEIRKVNKLDIIGLSIHKKNFLKKFGFSENMNLIIGNNVFQGIINIKECQNKVIFIIPHLWYY